MSTLAELDVLSSLSYVSFNNGDGEMVRPTLLDPKLHKPTINIKEMRHPCVSMMGVNFIPNDIQIGNIKQEDGSETNESVVFLTGPNMGGKSTGKIN